VLYTTPPLLAIKDALVPPFDKDNGNVGIDAVVARVPLVGKVTLVIPVIVNVDANAPEVVKLPPNVNVLEPLFTPVPPLAGLNWPVHPIVRETAWSRAVLGVPPNVSVTFVSLTSVNAAGVPMFCSTKSKTCCNDNL
jgi:hypothetical protein